MAIMGIVGLLGVGKTLSLTYMGIRNYLKGKKIYANYWLAFDYNFVSSVDGIERINNPKILSKTGEEKVPSTFLGDELWSWLDSRESPRKRNKFLTGLLLKSRRRKYDVFYTAQDIMQIDARLRRVTNFIAFPQMSPDKNSCILEIRELINYGLGKCRVGRKVKTLTFRTKFIFELYDTEDESWDL